MGGLSPGSKKGSSKWKVKYQVILLEVSEILSNFTECFVTMTL